MPSSHDAKRKKTMELKLRYTLPKDFLRNILISAFESGVHGSSSWATALEARDTHTRGYDALYISYDRKNDIEGARKGRKLIKLEHVAEGIRRILANKRIDLNNHDRGRLAAAVVTLDSGEVDGPLADCVIQAAVFNNVIYG